MIFQVLLYTLLILWWGENLALAQVDPSNASLLRSSGKSPDKNFLDSSRYTVRPEAKPQPQPRVEPPIESLKTQKIEMTPSSEAAPQLTLQKESTQPEVAPLNQKLKASQKDQQEITAQEKDLLLGRVEEIREFKPLLHSQDIRQNTIELDVATGIFGQNSSSNYWYRRYYSSGPMISTGVTLWLTHFFGFRSDFSTSLSSNMRGDPAGDRRILVHHLWWAGKVQLRKSLHLGRRSPHLLVAFGVSEHRVNVPDNDPDRIRVRTLAPTIEFGLQKPSSDSHIWELGVRLLPRGEEKEEKTGINIQSGSKQETNGIGFWVGSRFMMGRKHQLHWNLCYNLNKAFYEGQANTLDPVSGKQPRGVYVDTGVVIFKLGYTWAQ